MTDLARRIHQALNDDLALRWAGEVARVFDGHKLVEVRSALGYLHERALIHYDPSTGAISNVTAPLPEPAA